MFNHITKRNIILFVAIVLPLTVIAICGYYNSTSLIGIITTIYAMFLAIVTPIKLKNGFLKLCCKLLSFIIYILSCGFIFNCLKSLNAEIILVGNDSAYSTSYCRVGAEYTYVDSKGVAQSIPIEHSKVYIINNSDYKLKYYSVEYSNVLYEHYDKAGNNKQIIEPLTYKDVSFYPDYLLCPPPQTIKSQHSSNTVKYVLGYVFEIPGL